MRVICLLCAVLSFVVLSAAPGWADSIQLSNVLTADGDGDARADYQDNGLDWANADQADADGDGIGDVVDADNSVDNSLSITLTLDGPYTITVGGTVTIGVSLSATPPVGYGYVGFYLGDAGSYDPTTFDGFMAGTGGGAASLATGTTYYVDVAASFFTDANWDLNTAGTYDLHALLFGPGIISSSVSTYVTVNGVAPVPEPGTLALFGLGAAGLAWRRRSRKQ